MSTRRFAGVAKRCQRMAPVDVLRLALGYRTRPAGTIRWVGVERAGAGWLVVDVCGEDRRPVEQLDDPADRVEAALGVAQDYVAQAAIAGRPLVPRTPPASEALAA